MESPADDSIDTIVAEMQTYYGRRADWYDTSMGYDKPDIVDALEPVFDVLREEMRDRDVLEIACGPGFWTQRVATAARRMVATDYNESTLALARTKPIDPARVTFMRADAYDLSAIGGPFDGAFAVDFLAHVPASRLSSFLDGLHRRLVPGARVVFCDQLPWPGAIGGLRDAEGNHVQERVLPDGSRYRVIKHFFNDDELRGGFAPFSRSLDIRRFVDQRRVVVSYPLDVRRELL